MTQRNYLDKAKVTWFPKNKAYFRHFSPFAATLPRCCHAPERLYTKVFRKFRGSVAAKSRKKIFFQLIALGHHKWHLIQQQPKAIAN